MLLSVRKSVAYIVNNSRTISARKTKIGREIAQHTCDRHTSFKVKSSRSPGGPFILRHIMSDISGTVRPTNFKLSTQIDHDDPRHSGAVSSKVKPQGHVTSLTSVGP